MTILRSTGTDAYNPSLPAIVRQLLQMSGGDYELAQGAQSELYWRYYKNKQYAAEVLDKMKASTSAVAAIQQAKQLWRGIKPVFNVCTEAVDVDRRLCFKDARPLPVKRADDLEQRLADKWNRDGWGLKIDRSPLYGAVTGASYLRVKEGYLQGRGNENAPATLEVYSPEVMTVLRHPHDQDRVVAAKIEYRYPEVSDLSPTRALNDSPSTMVGALRGVISALLPQQAKAAVGLAPNEEMHRYTQIITEEAYYTFRDGALHAFGDLGNSWANRLGVVPVIDVPFLDIGEDTGLPTFHSIIDTLDSINSLGSMVGNIFLMHADPIIMAYGIPEPEEGKGFTKSTTAAGSTVFHIPQPPQFTGVQTTPPKMEYLEWKGGNIAALIEFWLQIKLDCERALPESLYRQVAASQRTGSGHEASINLQPLEDKELEIRKVQFAAAERALHLGLIADDLAGDAVSIEEMQERLSDARKKQDIFIWAQTVLPKDRAAESQQRSVDLADGVISQYTARLERGFTPKQAEEEAKRIGVEEEEKLQLERKRLMLQQEFGVSAKPASAGGNGNGNAPLAKPGSNANATRPTQGGQGSVPAANPTKAGQPNSRAGSPGNRGKARNRR